jgi:2-keto-3-deoxy-galactonokinase
LNVYIINEDLADDQNDGWIACLQVTEEKIHVLQTHIDFKRAELEAAAKENESFATRISDIRSSLCLLRRNMSSIRTSLAMQRLDLNEAMIC